MSAYVISRVSIRDAEAMARYVAGAPPTVAEFGGRYLVRANAATALEGSWEDDRIVVLEFPTREAALAWYHSPTYRDMRDLRWASADAVILLADGAAPDVASLLRSHPYRADGSDEEGGTLEGAAASGHGREPTRPRNRNDVASWRL